MLRNDGMLRLGPRRRGVRLLPNGLGGGLTYVQKILALFGSSIVSYIPDPFTGLDVSGHGYNGAPTAVTAAAGPDGAQAGSFDGSTSRVNWYSAGLAGAFNSQEGSVLLWVLVSAWDAAIKDFVNLGVNASNQILIRKQNANLTYYYIAGATTDFVTLGSNADIGFMQLVISWSKAADELKAYKNGAQVGATQSTLGTWAGALASTLTTIGASSTTPTNPMSGRAAHILLLNRAVTAAEVAQAYQVS